MKYSKPVILAVWGLLLMAWVSPASATTITAPATAIKGESEGSIVIHGVATATCKASAFQMNVEQSGSGVTAKGKLTSLTFNECDQHVVVIVRGSLEIHATGKGDGTVTWSNARMTVMFTTIFGEIHCEFATSATDAGVIHSNGTSTATWDLQSFQLPTIESAFLCGSYAQVSGSYTLTPVVSDALSIG